MASVSHLESVHVDDKDESRLPENENTLTDGNYNITPPVTTSKPQKTRDEASSISSDLRLPASEAGWETPKSWLHHFWTKQKGLALVILSQSFNVIMNVTTRLLEADGHHGPGMHPLQILFARMLGTLLLSVTYQFAAKVEHAPFGPRQVWGLLIARGVGGFFGVYGMYYSLLYLPLADATVLTFLAPLVACAACSVLLKEPFTRGEQIAAVVSIFGVVLIAKPASLISSSETGPVEAFTNSTSISNSTTYHHEHRSATPSQRLSAVAVAMLGVLGAACAYTTIRWIGQRAHPLISVNYFSFASMIIPGFCLLLLPSISFSLPANLTQWMYLISLGIGGFLMQFLLTTGLAYEKSSRATNMIYTQMLFAIAMDKLVWGTSPGMVSIVGSCAIIGSALYVSVLSNGRNASDASEDSDDGDGSSGGRRRKRGKANEADEEEMVGLMMEQDAGEESSPGPGLEMPLRGVHEVQIRTMRV